MTTSREHTHGVAALHHAGYRAAVAGCLAFVAGQTLALNTAAAQRAPGAQQPVAPRLSGKTFEGVRFASDPQAGPFAIRARRANAWSDGGASRLMLQGDVRIRIGPHEFIADRALVWIEPFDEGAPPPEPLPDGSPAPEKRQVAVFFENVREPAAAAGVGVSGPRLLLTAVTLGDLSLAVDRLENTRSDQPLVEEGESRLGRYLAELLDPPLPPETRARRTFARGGAAPAPIEQPEPPPARPHQPILNETALTGPLAPGQDPSLGPADRTTPIRSARGVVSFFGPTREWIGGAEENAVVISGGVAVNYTDASTGRAVQLTAERAVVFLRGGTPEEAATAGIDAVRGVYLEGSAVATDGKYTLRAPRLYTDLRTNKAIVLDAVFWTYDRLRSMPIYLRAKSIRQESDTQWKASEVRLANSSFFEPHLALGASSVTVTRRPARPLEAGDPLAGLPGAGDDQFYFDADGVALRTGGTNVLPLPRYRGDLSNPAIREVTIGARDDRPVVKTTWDLVRLLGLEQAEGFASDLLLDGYFSKGPAVGTDTRWNNADFGAGGVFGYYIWDNGKDDLTSGAELDHDDDHRGMTLLEHRWALSRTWTLFLEGAWVSDPAFVDAFFPRMAESRREITNSAYLRRSDEESVFSIEARGSFNDFSPNEYILQSQGFQVTRAPEARYNRPADSFFGGGATLSTEMRLGRVAFNLNEPTVNEFGFDTVERAGAAFGLLPTESLAQRLRAQGFNESTVSRFDTRHEVSVPLKLDQFAITPFGVGRFTAYDDDFDAFAGRDEDQYRVYGAAGARLATSFQHIDDSAESRFFDVHRLRHVVEPSATVWHGETSRTGALPAYDDDVESLVSGSGFRTGVLNTWQTQRGAPDGGPDDWVDVDWLTIRTDYVWFDGSVDRESPILRWVENKPELSNAGEFIDNEATMQLTDAVALSARTVFDMEQSGLAYQTAGVLVDHGEGFSTFTDFRYIDARDTTLLDFGARYALSRKYAILGQAAYDIDNGDIQSYVVRVERRFPQTSVEVAVGHDTITDDTFFAVSLRPVGFGGPDRRRLLSPIAEYDRPAVRPMLGDRGPVWPLRSNQSIYGP